MNNKYLLSSCFSMLLLFFATAQDTDFDIGVEAYADEDYHKAVMYFSKVIENQTDQNDWYIENAYYNIGLAHHQLGNYYKAIKILTTFIKINPKDPKGYFARANAYLYIQEYKNAEIDNIRAIQFDSKNSDSYYNLGICYDNLGDSNLAIEQYSKAIELSPYWNDNYYYNRALCYVDVKEYEKAKSDYDEAININNQDANYFWGRGFMSYTLKYYDASIEDYSEAIKLDSTTSSLFYNRGISYYEINFFDEAILDFQKVDSTSDYYIDANWYIVLCNEELQNFDDALEYYEDVENLDSNYSYLKKIKKKKLITNIND